MIVTPLGFTCADERIVLQARISLETAGADLHRELWFEVPSCLETVIDTQVADCFAAAMLPLAMALAEPLRVEGVLSPRFAYGASEYQRILCHWFPRDFANVEIQAKEYVEQRNCSSGVVSSFSGGVDSFYTLWRHTHGRDTRHMRVTHALLVHGFDIPLSDQRTFRDCCDHYSSSLASIGVTLVPLRTNIRELTAGVSWLWSHGAGLVAAALVLSKAMRHFLIPSSHRYADNFGWGSHPLLDHWLSSSTTEVLHDAASVSRFQKTAAVANWELAQSSLRVCPIIANGIRNCGSCDKCVRTMLALELSGSLSRHTNFDVALDIGRVRELRFRGASPCSFAEDLLVAARKHERADVASALEFAIKRSTPSFLTSSARRLLRPMKRRVVEWVGGTASAPDPRGGYPPLIQPFSQTCSNTKSIPVCN